MIFSSDPGQFRQALIEQGYVHLKGILSDEFIACLKDFHRRAVEGEAGEHLPGYIPGKKRQFVFHFPSRRAAHEFRRGMSRLMGLDEEKFTVSERHLKLYDSASNPWPAPHKDRAASHFSIGLPIHLPEGSTVCLFPELDPGPNEKEKAVFLTRHDVPDLEEVYRRKDAVMLNEKVGDIVAFHGSSIFHERVRAAGTAVLYIKINDDGRDPLGEDIYHTAMEPAE